MHFSNDLWATGKTVFYNTTAESACVEFKFNWTAFNFEQKQVCIQRWLHLEMNSGSQFEQAKLTFWLMFCKIQERLQQRIQVSALGCCPGKDWLESLNALGFVMNTKKLELVSSATRNVSHILFSVDSLSWAPQLSLKLSTWPGFLHLSALYSESEVSLPTKRRSKAVKTMRINLQLRMCLLPFQVVYCHCTQFACGGYWGAAQQ